MSELCEAVNSLKIRIEQNEKKKDMPSSVATTWWQNNQFVWLRYEIADTNRASIKLKNVSLTNGTVTNVNHSHFENELRLYATVQVKKQEVSRTAEYFEVKLTKMPKKQTMWPCISENNNSCSWISKNRENQAEHLSRQTVEQSNKSTSTKGNVSDDDKIDFKKGGEPNFGNVSIKWLPPKYQQIPDNYKNLMSQMPSAGRYKEALYHWSHKMIEEPLFVPKFFASWDMLQGITDSLVDPSLFRNLNRNRTAWIDDVKEPERFIVDCYKNRVEDNYVFGAGNVCGLYSGAGQDEVSIEFLTFMKLAAMNKLFHDEFDFEKCLKIAADVLTCAVDEDTLIEQYTGRDYEFNSLCGLRKVGEQIYGGHYGEDSVDNRAYKMVRKRADAAYENYMNERNTPDRRKVYSDIGGHLIWIQLMDALDEVEVTQADDDVRDSVNEQYQQFLSDRDF